MSDGAGCRGIEVPVSLERLVLTSADWLEDIVQIAVDGVAGKAAQPLSVARIVHAEVNRSTLGRVSSASPCGSGDVEQIRWRIAGDFCRASRVPDRTSEKLNLAHHQDRVANWLAGEW